MPSPVALDVKHHTFLQALMNRGPLREDLVIHMFQSLLKTSSVGTVELSESSWIFLLDIKSVKLVVQEPRILDEFCPCRIVRGTNGFNSFLGEMNKDLEFVDMELKKVTNQNDGKEYFGIINKLSSPQSKLGTRYSLAQLAYFKAVMEAIALESSGAGFINSTRALNLKPAEFQQVDLSQFSTSQVEISLKMTLGAKDEALDILVHDHWLNRNGEGEISLGTRAYLELRGVFRELEVPFCEVCNEAAITADLCEKPDCPVRMHSYCAVKKFRGRQAKVCSRCQTGWLCGAERSQPSSLKREIEGGTEEHPDARRRTRYFQNPSQKPFGQAISNEEEPEDEEEITRLDSDDDVEASSCRGRQSRGRT